MKMWLEIIIGIVLLEVLKFLNLVRYLKRHSASILLKGSIVQDLTPQIPSTSNQPLECPPLLSF